MWVRALEDRALHGLALRLRRKFWEGDSTSAEDWLLDRCISELEYRSRRAARNGTAGCFCEMCQGPFEDQGVLPGMWEERPPF